MGNKKSRSKTCRLGLLPRNKVNNTEWREMKNRKFIATNILREFVDDVEAVGIHQIENEWPDIAETYKHAKKFLGDIEDETIKPFKIFFINTEYKVSIPNYKGGEVYRKEDIEKLLYHGVE